MAALPKPPGPPTQAPAVTVRAAPVWRRAAACGLDTAAPLGVAVAVGVALWPAGASTLPWNALDVAVDAYWMVPTALWGPLAVWFGLSFVLHAAFEAAGAPTPGQRALGLRLVGRAGDRVRPGRALTHAALRLASTAVAGGGHLWALADPGRQALHDRLSGVRLVHEPRAPEVPGQGSV